MSESVPPQAFVKRWEDERYAGGLTFSQREELLSLTARSGVIANLEFALAVVGCPPTSEVYMAAAESGHRDACIWLEDRGCPRDEEAAVEAAARAGHAEIVRWKLLQFPSFSGSALDGAAGGGHRALCEEMVAAGASPGDIQSAAFEAAEGGHVELTEWLLGLSKERNFGPDEFDQVLLDAAWGFELPALQRLYHSQLGSSAAQEEFGTDHGPSMVVAAFTSATPDWRAKLEWLEAKTGCRLDKEAFEALTTMDACEAWRALELFWEWEMDSAFPDVLGRVTLLRERGMLHVGSCLNFAVYNTNLPLIHHLKSEGLLAASDIDIDLMVMASQKGDLAVLAELLAAGGPIGPGVVRTAARFGHLHVLLWMAGPEASPDTTEALQQALLEDPDGLTRCAAGSGSLELMEWLWERGCRQFDEKAFTAAVGAGNTALLEWMVARGCPMSSKAYQVAGDQRDIATLRCLRRLGCPWDRDTFNTSCSLEVLRWLEAEGCSVDWHAAWARYRWSGKGTPKGLAAGPGCSLLTNGRARPKGVRSWVQ
ncbi:hypothetical protein PLESTM_000166300 [Pleodorina starrii]|nr:hypothetical protein PLESTM_000166300 [Pleodorina starrii]